MVRGEGVPELNPALPSWMQRERPSVRNTVCTVLVGNTQVVGGLSAGRQQASAPLPGHRLNHGIGGRGKLPRPGGCTADGKGRAPL